MPTDIIPATKEYRSAMWLSGYSVFLKAAYDICCSSDAFIQDERDHIHFYLAVRSIVFKLTKGDAPDLAQMNAKIRELIKDALVSDGVEDNLRC